ncbi:TadA family conjugal transfer-associated ATPase [Corynebacterium uterequi]|uniref:Helicase/secretion neighborhood ATPase n=1 Tax=Corynebacterium uterequi TaxID=1072256 RepID=A0A0G3HA60_9CORY|nr:TadA family conjugal transfer-associated ATPase [Corynebacterium uterequi]AKK10199.1 helicase/secretion neighborhood ATPase [Corynebacterium uterequi]
MISPDLMDKLHRRYVAEPALAGADAATLARVVREEAGVISDVDVLDVLRRLHDDTHGAGPLERLLTLDGVTDVCVNSPTDVWIDRGRGMERAALSFDDDADVRRLACRLAGQCGQRLDDARPFVDGRLRRDDGTAIRLHAVLSPPARTHTAISLRVLRQNRTSLAELAESGTFPLALVDALREVIDAHRSVLVTGGTGSGKTTLLSALLAEVDPSERIICIEDTAELDPAHPHVLGLTTRRANTENAGAITMSELLIQALRMRPDRVVVGEIRGAEVVDLLAALNTGHHGGAGTVHANSAAEVPARLEALAALGGLGRTALHSQLAAAVDVVLTMRKDAHGHRRRYLAEIATLAGNPVTVRVVWRPGQDITDELRARLRGELP